MARAGRELPTVHGDGFLAAKDGFGIFLPSFVSLSQLLGCPLSDPHLQLSHSLAQAPCVLRSPPPSPFLKAMCTFIVSASTD